MAADAALARKLMADDCLVIYGKLQDLAEHAS